MKVPFSLFIAWLAIMEPDLQAQLSSTGATASFKGALPPPPVADISPSQQSALEKELTEVTKAFQSVKKHEHAADADIFLKAVRFAIEFHEWYDKKPEDNLKKARALLAEAASRIQALKNGKSPWLEGTGMKVLGFYSRIDGSPQPYGAEIPAGLNYGAGRKPVPMWIWLHGRSDTGTDLHFIADKMKGKGGPFKPANAIVIHPFGRYCNGWKSAGETDVLEAKAYATKRFNIDENRIALAGFSMGGAGAWHLGAHFADQWACVHTGAGFVDVKRYQKLTPEKFPPWYEQKLWGVYDVPDYARNFLNVPLVCYSGEIDAQRDSAEYMMEVLGKEGLHPPHLIGPGMPHKYHPETIKEVQKLIEAAVAKGRNPFPKKVVLQTRCLKYNRMYWLTIGALAHEWEDARLEGEIDDAKKEIRITAKNVLMFHCPTPQGDFEGYKVIINGVVAEGNAARGYVFVGANANGQARWVSAGRGESFAIGKKGWEASGPIDFAFQDRFVIVLPDQAGRYPKVDQWVKVESQHFIKRWRGLMRGDPLVIKASELNENVRGTPVLWGDPTSNSQIRRIQEHLQSKWQGDKLIMGSQSFDASTHVVMGVQAWGDSVQAKSTVVAYLNSGLTFREAHDKTNSLQNPKLPDWAILDISQPPNPERAGKVVAADFFDENWQVKPNMPAVDSK